MENQTFTCMICGEPSKQICVYCTKDTCDNHLCERCSRCSDCCVCEMPVNKQRQSFQAETVPTAQTGGLTLNGTEKAAVTE